MDTQPDVPTTEADVALVAHQPVGRGGRLLDGGPSQDLDTPDSIMEFFRLLRGGPGTRRPHHRQCSVRRPDSSVLYLEAPTQEPLADSAQPQVAARGRQSLVWFIPNEPRVRLPQDVLAKRCSGPGESSSNALRICKRHGSLVGKHVSRSHHIHVERPRGRSCPPPDPVGQGHGGGGGRPPHQRPTRFWIHSKRVFRSQQRLWIAPSSVVVEVGPAGGDQIAAAVEENALALQSLRIQPDAAEGASTEAVAGPSSSQR